MLAIPHSRAGDERSHRGGKRVENRQHDRSYIGWSRNNSCDSHLHQQITGQRSLAVTKLRRSGNRTAFDAGECCRGQPASTSARVSTLRDWRHLLLLIESRRSEVIAATLWIQHCEAASITARAAIVYVATGFRILPSAQPWASVRKLEMESSHRCRLIHKSNSMPFGRKEAQVMGNGRGAGTSVYGPRRASRRPLKPNITDRSA